ncbi:MAG: hypothetical protein JKX76_00950 [Colwellia sp.]|nr:hypothetical protein [Colwellia sp.]
MTSTKIPENIVYELLTKSSKSEIITITNENNIEYDPDGGYETDDEEVSLEDQN